MNVEKVFNGYIVKDSAFITRVFRTLDEVFESMLLTFEGRAESFSESYGKVTVERGGKPGAGNTPANTNV